MKVIVLSGGFDQIALIEKLKSRGHEVILVDYLDNPPAKSKADSHCKISTLNEADVLKCAMQNNVNLVTTACTDQAVLTAAKVSEKLELPFYISASIARNVTDKVFMKKKFLENNIPSAKYVSIDDSTYISDINTGDLKYPLVVKPCDCNSSKGVTKIFSEKDLECAVKNALLLSRSKKAIIESFIDGKEISIDVWNDNEGVKILCISGTEKIKSNRNEFTIYQSSYPVQVSKDLKLKIQSAAERIADGFGLHNCPMLIQAIVKDEELYILEFSARMGGGSKYKLIEYTSSIDIIECYINRILGDTTQIISPKQSDKFVELDYVYAYNGTFSKLVNFDKLKNSGIIKEVFQYKMCGDVIEKRETSSDRIAGFLLEEDSYENLIKSRQEILREVDVVDSDGKSMMYKKCFLY